MVARRHWQEGAFAPLWKCCKVFLCINNYSKTLSRRIIYALFSQTVVSFWPPDRHRSSILDRAGNFLLQTPNCPPLEKIPQAPMLGEYANLTQARCSDKLWSQTVIYQDQEISPNKRNLTGRTASPVSHWDCKCSYILVLYYWHCCCCCCRYFLVVCAYCCSADVRESCSATIFIIAVYYLSHSYSI